SAGQQIADYVVPRSISQLSDGVPGARAMAAALPATATDSRGLARAALSLLSQPENAGFQRQAASGDLPVLPSRRQTATSRSPDDHTGVSVPAGFWTEILGILDGEKMPEGAKSSVVPVPEQAPVLRVEPPAPGIPLQLDPDEILSGSDALREWELPDKVWAS